MYLQGIIIRFIGEGTAQLLCILCIGRCAIAADQIARRVIAGRLMGVHRCLIAADYIAIFIVAALPMYMRGRLIAALEIPLRVVAALIMGMGRRLITADQLSLCIVALSLVHMRRCPIAADQLPGIVIALGQMDMRGVMAADQVAFPVVAVLGMDVQLRALVQRRHLFRGQLHGLEALFRVHMLFQLGQLTGWQASLYQVSILVEALLVIAAVVMGVELQLPAYHSGDFFIAFIRMDVGRGLALLSCFRRLLRLCRRGVRLGVAGLNMFVLFQSACQLPLVAAFRMGVLLFSTGIFRRVAALLVGMLLQAAGQVAVRVVAALSMGMLFGCAGKGLGGAGLSMYMLFRESADQCVFIAALSMGMGLLAADRLFRRCGFGGGGRDLRRFRLFRLLQLADQNLLGDEALFCVLMRLALLQRADQVALLVVAGIVVHMDDIIRVPADGLCPQVPVLVLLVAIICMPMHFVLAVQHFHLMGHGLTVQLQSRDRTEGHYHSQAQEHYHLASVLFLFLQKLRRLC